MKRFLFAILSMCLVLTFSTKAFSVDVKFSGSFYAAGMYLDKTKVTNYGAADPANSQSDNVSTAFYYQRLRAQTDFVVSPGLTLVTRFDAMERAWGASRASAGTTWPAASATDTGSAGTVAENENIAFDWIYINYDSPIGTFRVGNMNDGAWGTVFMDSSMPRGKVAWSNTTGSWFYTLQLVKITDKSSNAKYPVKTMDTDSDKYVAAVRYTWKDGQAGLLGGVGRDATKRPVPDSYLTLFYTLQPYAIAQIGPVKVQAEIDYFWGTWQKMESGGEVKLDNLAAFLDATADFGRFYAGGTLAYISGDDPATTDKKEGNSLLVNGGRDWDPCLILFNNERSYWAGAITGYSATQNPNVNDAAPGTAGGMTNAWFFQGRAGVRPIAALDIMASISYATADKKPATVLNSTYGYEIDVTGTYKITNNLSYMIGIGYLFTGDYFKGSSNANQLADDYLLINKLTLTF